MYGSVARGTKRRPRKKDAGCAAAALHVCAAAGVIGCISQRNKNRRDLSRWRARRETVSPCALCDFPCVLWISYDTRWSPRSVLPQFCIGRIWICNLNMSGKRYRVPIGYAAEDRLFKWPIIQFLFTGVGYVLMEYRFFLFLLITVLIHEALGHTAYTLFVCVRGCCIYCVFYAMCTCDALHVEERRSRGMK